MANASLQACQREAEEVTVLMKKNVDRVFEREAKLSNLEVRSEELKTMASNFQKTAHTVERKARWEKWRWYIISGVFALVVLIIIIAIIASQFSGGGGDPSENP